MRGALSLAGALLLALVVAVGASAAGRAHAGAHADLVESRVGTPPARVVPGGSIQLADTVINRGRARAPRTTTRFYLLVASRMLLLGARRVPSLGPGRSSRGRTALRIPTGTRAGHYPIIVCADAARRVHEAAEANNCRATRPILIVAAPSVTGLTPPGRTTPSPGHVTPPPGTADSDHDGYPDNVDCAPHDPAIHPGAPDVPDPQFVDSNCDGIDGDLAHAIFVSPLGDDANPGTRSAPKRTFAAAIPAAATRGKDVYATFGTYTERLDVHDGVGVYGGYSADWAQRGVGVTLITGATEAGSTVGAVANGISSATTLQLVTLAPGAPTQPGGNSYGLRGANSPGLRLQYVTVRAAAGANGDPGKDGTPGVRGGGGSDGATLGGPEGGSSAVGHIGGAGAPGGKPDLPSGGPGVAGYSRVPDQWGAMGGPGGIGGAGGSDHGPGGRGGFGDSGRFLGDGIAGGGAGGPVPLSATWKTQDGQGGQPGSDGHGGGGGGGGGADDCLFCSDDGGKGGGGGGGGQGGGGGAGGHGGGASLGVFLINSAGARLDHANITASDGGSGGRGGNGAFGGVGGAGGGGSNATGSDASPGGDGGPGGAGGRGGDGAGGGGGSSIGVFGLDPVGSSATTVHHGNSGAGGPGGSGAGNGGGHGVAGLVADYMP